MRPRQQKTVSASDINKLGALGTYGYWEDSAHTSGSPQSITGGTRTLFTVNGLGGNTETSYLDSADTGIFSSNTINPVSVGDAFMVRMGITIEPDSVSQGEYVEVELDIGSGSEINIVTDRIELTKGIGVAHAKTITFPIFCLSTFNTNGGKIYITPSIDVDVYGRTLFLQRSYKP